MSPTATGMSGPAGTGRDIPEGMKPGSAEWVLVVDDDEEVRETVDVVLAEHGLLSLSASGGLAALDLLRGHRVRPKVILLDLRMPQMSGIEMVEAMRQVPELADTPIVVMSGDSDAVRLAAQLSAEDCLRKPFELSALVSAVRRFAGGNGDDGHRNGGAQKGDDGEPNGSEGNGAPI